VKAVSGGLCSIGHPWRDRTGSTELIDYGMPCNAMSVVTLRGGSVGLVAAHISAHFIRGKSAGPKADRNQRHCECRASYRATKRVCIYILPSIHIYNT